MRHSVPRAGRVDIATTRMNRAHQAGGVARAPRSAGLIASELGPRAIAARDTYSRYTIARRARARTPPAGRMHAPLLRAAALYATVDTGAGAT